MGQNFCRSSYGSFNVLGTLGGSFATDNKRSDFVFAGLHLDYDFANMHKIYPLIELNWAQYTGNGSARNLNFDGRDLFNLGSNSVSGDGIVTLAFGARYKFCEWAQVGSAVEWGLTGRSSLEDFRFTLDMIFRY
jgi:hypothetical protein